MGFQTPLFFLLMLSAAAAFWPARKYRLLVLAIFDCLFYMAAGTLDFALLAGASILSYGTAMGMSLSGSSRARRKAFFLIGVLGNVLNLAFFKYYYFVLGGISKVAPVPSSLTSLKIVLPIGISFYTFQLIAYLVDVYREEIAPISNFLAFWVFISFFGQVIAGPIMRAKDFAPQVAKTESFTFDFNRLKKGLMLFSIGLGKKLILADTLSPLVDKYFQKGVSMSSVDIWIAAYLFAFQIYYDFSAYSEMALGVGNIFGYDLSPNFNTPYISQNPQEFWRRWHITLSTWVRDYLYIPMGGSKKGFVRGLWAVIAAMCISGLWHGAAWTFVLWGLYHGILSALHRIWHRCVGKRIKPSPSVRALGVLFFLQLTVIGWVLFRVQDSSSLFPLLRKMLTFSDLSLGPHFVQYVALIVGLYLLHLTEAILRRRSAFLWRFWEEKVPPVIRGLTYCGVVLLLSVYLKPKANAFIYFQF